MDVIDRVAMEAATSPEWNSSLNPPSGASHPWWREKKQSKVSKLHASDTSFHVTPQQSFEIGNSLTLQKKWGLRKDRKILEGLTTNYRWDWNLNLLQPAPKPTQILPLH